MIRIKINIKSKYDIGYKRYNEFNLVIVILASFVVVLPIIVYLVRLIFPNMIRCPYYEFTSKPCPFCGVTTDIRNIIKGKLFAYKYNLISVPILAISILEFGARLYLLCNKNKLNNIDLRIRIFKLDFIYHMNIFVIILIYIVAFFIFDMRRF